LSALRRAAETKDAELAAQRTEVEGLRVGTSAWPGLGSRPHMIPITTHNWVI